MIEGVWLAIFLLLVFQPLGYDDYKKFFDAGQDMVEVCCRFRDPEDRKIDLNDGFVVNLQRLQFGEPFQNGDVGLFLINGYDKDFFSLCFFCDNSLWWVEKDAGLARTLAEPVGLRWQWKVNFESWVDVSKYGVVL